LRRRVTALTVLAFLVCTGTASAVRHEVIANAHVSPGPHLFGDRIDVVVDAVVDTDRVDPASVRVEVELAPYESFGKATRIQEQNGRFARVSYRYPVACLSIDCIPEAPKKVPTEKRITFPPASVRYVDRKGKRQSLSVVVPAVRLVSRALPGTQSGPASFFRDPIEDLRAPARTLHDSYRAEPSVMGAVFLGASLLALAASLAFGWPALRRAYSALKPVVAAPSTTPLDDALARVERASAEQPGTTEHREALARLVRELRSAGLDELVEPARRLAWSAESPTPASSRELATRIRQAVVVHA
jgi:hypothetical protein